MKQDAVPSLWAYGRLQLALLIIAVNPSSPPPECPLLASLYTELEVCICLDQSGETARAKSSCVLSADPNYTIVHKTHIWHTHFGQQGTDWHCFPKRIHF